MLRSFRLIVALAFALGLAASASPARADGPKRLALVVGVSQYADRALGTQPFADNDAQALADVLKARGYQVVLMTQAAGGAMVPTAANLSRELEKVTSTAGLGAGDTVVVALSGRGVELGAGTPDGPAVHFLPTDADAAGAARTLPVKAIYDAMGNCPAGTKLLVADLFHAGPQVPGSPAARPAMPIFPAPPDGLAVYLGCSPQQMSADDPAAKQGVFFQHLARGLDGKADANRDNKVTLSELTTFVESGVYDFSRRVTDAPPQVPELKGLTRPGAVTEGPYTPTPTRPVVPPTTQQVIPPVAIVDPPVRPPVVQPPVRPPVVQPPPGPVGPFPSDNPPSVYPPAVTPAAVVTARPPPPHPIGRPGKPVHLIDDDIVEKFVEANHGKKDAVEDLQEDAQKDLACAFYLAQLYEHGSSLLVPADPASAIKWYRHAADNGVSEAMIQLSYLYQTGRGVKADAAEAYKWRLRAAEAGDPLGMYLVAIDCAYGVGVRQDMGVARQWMQQAANTGDAPAREWLAANP